MSSLVSAEYSLKAFCDAMHGNNPLEIMDAAGVEIASAHRLNQEATKRSDFRKGSKGREYCDNLSRGPAPGLFSLHLVAELPVGNAAEPSWHSRERGYLQ